MLEAVLPPEAAAAGVPAAGVGIETMMGEPCVSIFVAEAIPTFYLDVAVWPRLHPSGKKMEERRINRMRSRSVRGCEDGTTTTTTGWTR